MSFLPLLRAGVPNTSAEERGLTYRGRTGHASGTRAGAGSRLKKTEEEGSKKNDLDQISRTDNQREQAADKDGEPEHIISIMWCP